MHNNDKSVFHDDLITELICWIEVNLTDRLTLEKASKKTGYSIWYLQRLFKSKTGYALGKYIRDRRLTMAALALRLTNITVFDISLYFAYDSQGTFTRSFKKKFNETPVMYRRRALWTSDGLTPVFIVEKPCLNLVTGEQNCVFESVMSMAKLKAQKITIDEDIPLVSIADTFFEQCKMNIQDVKATLNVSEKYIKILTQSVQDQKRQLTNLSC